MSNGLWNNDGSIRVTVVLGTSFTGLYAADGSLNVVENDVSHVGLYHPCGALRVNTTPAVGVYDPSGALFLIRLVL